MAGRQGCTLVKVTWEAVQQAQFGFFFWEGWMEQLMEHGVYSWIEHIEELQDGKDHEMLSL